MHPSRRFFVVAAIAGTLALVTGTGPLAQERGPPGLVGSWVVRHGILRLTYVFAPDGRYRYQSMPGVNGGLEETIGAYQVQGNRLVLTSREGRQDYLWRLGKDQWTTQIDLFLTDSFGSTELFYRDNY